VIPFPASASQMMGSELCAILTEARIFSNYFHQILIDCIAEKIFLIEVADKTFVIL
jgi:hypothetical protein